MDHNYYVYILSSTNGVLYVGVTKDLVRRVAQHKARQLAGFTKRYNVDQLVYFEHTHDVNAAIAREKQIKGWVREKKAVLIESRNPQWVDLYPGLVTPDDDSVAGKGLTGRVEGRLRRASGRDPSVGARAAVRAR